MATSSFEGMAPDHLSGRSLDAEVAPRLFSLSVQPRENSRTHQLDFVYQVHVGQLVQVPYYSSGSAWLNVSEELSKRGWTKVPMPRHLGTQWNEGDGPTVVLQHADGRRVEATGPENVALCRAALQAVSLPHE